MGRDRGYYDPKTDTQYMPARPPKPQPKTAKARAAAAERRAAAARKRADIAAQVGTQRQHLLRMERVDRRKAGQMDMDDFLPRPGKPNKLGAFFLTGLQSFSGGIDDLWMLGREPSGGGAGGDWRTERKKK